VGGELVTELVRIPFGDGGSILVETADPGSGPVRAGRTGDTVRQLRETLHEMLQPVTETAEILLEHLAKAKPDELEVEFGIDLSAEAGVVITKARAGANVKVKMKWKAAAEPGPATPPA
jgi:hypothetical protein